MTSDSEMTIGPAVHRVEGPAKVTGEAKFETDVHVAGMAQAALVLASSIGEIESLDLAAAYKVSGVLAIFTSEELGRAIAPVKHAMAGGWANSSLRPLASTEVAYPGQIVALVVAETGESASEAAQAVSVRLKQKGGTFQLEGAGEKLADLKDEHEDAHIGDVEAAWARAAARIEATYETPIQHHNPMELFATTCAWEGDRLTVHEPSRFVCGLQHGLAAQLGIPAENVRVVSRLVGGHFGSRLGLSQHTALVALAARLLRRPVQLVPTRRDGFTIANHRPESRHAIRLAADAAGHLTAFSHHAVVATSRFDDFAMQGTDVTAALYACPNIAVEERVARVDRNTPGPMRAPPEVPYLFALESAMDELAHVLAIDPIELRRRNDTTMDPLTGKRYTTRPLMRCFEAGAAAFGWDRARHPRREGEWLVGAGCAAAVRPTKIGPAALRLTRTAEGALVETAQHEIGNGITTLLAMAASEGLDVPIEAVTVHLGDTRLPPAGLSGGSSTTTSLMNAMDEACSRLRALLHRRGRNGPDQANVTVEHLPDGFGRDAVGKLDTGHVQLGQVTGDRIAAAFGAQFAEVRVHAYTGEIRVPRLVGAFAAGRIRNRLTAHSQLLGGMVWGMGSALLEATEVDLRTGSYINANLADYLVATAADAPSVEALIVEDDDIEVNPAGIKGLGEISIIGVNAAIANAVFAATGKRCRRLPIRLEDLSQV